MIATTYRRIPFDHMGPDEFERLCLALIRRTVDENAEHLGASGADGGYDLRVRANGKTSCFQCKRVAAFSSSHAKVEIDKIRGGDNIPDEIIFLISCDVSSKTRQDAERLAGVPCTFWARSELEDRLWQHRDIVERFFGPLPVPKYRDERSERLSTQLDAAYLQRDALLEAKEDTASLEALILSLKRDLRHGPQLLPGEFLADGRYQLLDTIGQGGFATVWLSHDRQSDQYVAIKVLHGQFSSSGERCQRLFRGARQMAKLEHPNVVRVLSEPVVQEDWAYFVMEHMARGDFRRAVLDGQLDLEARLHVLENIASALDVAHRCKVIHRDVKPSNILLAADGTPKLTDFDLVLAADTTGLTRTRHGMGSHLYAAPECMEDAARADARCDVYSLAATLVFALRGEELTMLFWRDHNAFLAQLALGDEALEVLQRGLHLDPAQRPESATELCRDFRAALRVAERPAKARDRPRTVPSKSSATPHARQSASRSASQPRRSSDLFRTISTRDGEMPLWCEIPAGKGWIGSPGNEMGRFSDEGPRHQLKTRAPFWLAAVPVTNAQYAKFAPDQANLNMPNHPVVKVSWDDAMKFCGWLADTQGFRGARLPTEEEWEYACRAGTETGYWSGDSVGDLHRVGWYKRNSGDSTHGVGEKIANPWGLYDVHGNVWEWTASRWKADFKSQASGLTIDPADIPIDLAEPAPSAARVIRGGSCWNVPQLVRSAYRFRGNPGFEPVVLGFRVLLPFAPSDP